MKLRKDPTAPKLNELKDDVYFSNLAHLVDVQRLRIQALEHVVRSLVLGDDVLVDAERRREYPPCDSCGLYASWNRRCSGCTPRLDPYNLRR